ncbi:MAG: hypothetical protein SWZ49_02705 [Cyanobacteriota bacterium]|nr:hypothetical protein [Cyanobacteriota bacterium]
MTLTKMLGSFLVEKGGEGETRGWGDKESGGYACSQVLPGNAFFEALPPFQHEAEPQAMGSQSETWKQL